MGIYIEAISLYILLFLSGSITQISGTAADFSAAAGIIKILLYIVPSLALILYLALKTQKPENGILKPGKKDLLSGLITFPCLVITGFIMAFLPSFFNKTAIQITLVVPSSVMGWVILCLVSVLSAYLEESYFRFYILSKRKEFNLSKTSALTLSVLLFSICHIYMGPWGFFNAVISGTFLGFMFLRYNSLHGIAIAHGLYNIAVYVIYALVN
ncbi:MAG: CPBP family intramembrane metalloprotease [Treponema sp.]|nr:CPBP family intramembrane metalloprotease [Treponema sp.]